MPTAQGARRIRLVSILETICNPASLLSMTKNSQAAKDFWALCVCLLRMKRVYATFNQRVRFASLLAGLLVSPVSGLFLPRAGLPVSPRALSAGRQGAP